MRAALALTPETVGTLKKIAIPNSISRAWKIGKYISLAKINHQNPSNILFKQINGIEIFKGKIVKVNYTI